MQGVICDAVVNLRRSKILGELITFVRPAIRASLDQMVYTIVLSPFSPSLKLLGTPIPQIGPPVEKRIKEEIVYEATAVTTGPRYEFTILVHPRLVQMISTLLVNLVINIDESMKHLLVCILELNLLLSHTQS